MVFLSKFFICLIAVLVNCLLVASSQGDGALKAEDFKNVIDRELTRYKRSASEDNDKCGKRCGHHSHCDNDCPKCAKHKHSKHGKCEAVDDKEEGDKCGKSCKKDSQCDDTCSVCHKERDPWGERKKKGICVEAQEKDKCGKSCKRDSQCDDTCSVCHKELDEWGAPKKKGICIEAQEQDKCGARCKHNSDCDDTCSYCEKKKDAWGRDKKRGKCVAAMETEKSSVVSHKSSVESDNSMKSDCHCKQGKRYCHSCRYDHNNRKRCKYHRDGTCQRNSYGQWEG